jgi:hypothetical protein
MIKTIRCAFATCCLLACHIVLADAIVRTQAMFATTIAEFFVQEERVLVEIEIGLADIEAFRNLLPDEIYQRMGYEPEPLSTRLQTFFAEDLVILANDERLSGRMLEIGPRERVRRDEVTGEPITLEEGEPEVVIFARLEYPFGGRPKDLTIGGPSGTRQASVGFIVYHDGIAVNDFRYLSPEQTLKLDWGDPWYTAFDNRNLRRTYFAPMSGFIYVEPYEVRKEIIVRPKDLERWIDLGLADRMTIPVKIQPELKRKVGEFLREHHPVTIDGEPIEPELARINFLERSLRTSRVIDPPEELPVNAAILGAIFVYATAKPLPQQVRMQWDLFDDRIQMVPASSVDQAGPLPTFLEPDFATLEWTNFLKNPQLPTLEVLLPPPSALQRAALYARWILLALSIAVAWWALPRVRQQQAAAVPASVAALVFLVTGVTFWLASQATLDEPRARSVVSGLLHNVYRAFDFRKEEDIYDVLVQSVEGELLQQIYLDTRKGLELANQGGARAKVKQIELSDLDAKPGDNGGFIADATWTVAGSVGHWGHVHERVNRYRGLLTIEPLDGAWKLVAAEVLEEERI